MKWIKVENGYPMSNVNVHVVTDTGKRGAARYWVDIGIWLTADPKLTVNDSVIKWKYEEAAISN